MREGRAALSRVPVARLREIFSSALSRARRELLPLTLLLLSAGGVLGFLELAEDVVEGDTHAMDERVLLALRNPLDLADPIGPPWLEEAARDITALGSTTVVTLVCGLVLVYLAVTRQRGAALLLLAAVGGGTLLAFGLKLGFERPRPDLVPHEARVFTASFPSAHAATSAVAYLTLGTLLARLEPRRRLKLYVLACAMVLTLAIGASRVYLGVHWPSDVLAGWAVGAAWAILCWLVARWLQRRGRVEHGPDAS